jgi:hypothetical protein
MLIGVIFDCDIKGAIAPHTSRLLSFGLLNDFGVTMEKLNVAFEANSHATA